MKKKGKVIIFGAGFTGTVLAITLRKRGYLVEVYERRPDIRKTEVSAAISINMVISHRGLHTLRRLGVMKKLETFLTDVKGRVLHRSSGEKKTYKFTDEEFQNIKSIGRVNFNRALIEIAERDFGVKFYFNSSCLSADENGNAVVSSHRVEQRIQGDVLIGADGERSTVRSSMIARGNFRFEQLFLKYGYKELLLTKENIQDIENMEGYWHIWIRDGFLLTALPRRDGNFVGTLYLPFTGKESFQHLQTRDKILDFFTKYFPNIVGDRTNIATDFLKNPIGRMSTIKLNPWYLGKILVIGDAAHAFTPFYNQGLNASLEDCIVLDRLLDAYDDNWKKTMIFFSENRRLETNAIADISRNSFMDKRDSRNPKYLLKLNALKLLQDSYDGIQDDYFGVLFTLTPYSTILKKREIINQVVDKMCRGIDHIKEFDVDAAAEEIKRKFKDLEELH